MKASMCEKHCDNKLTLHYAKTPERDVMYQEG